MDKEAGRKQIEELVALFSKNSSDHSGSRYNETQARNDFITPMLIALGWDINNTSGRPSSVREVVVEANVETIEGGNSKRPDYELRLSRQRKFFVEAKKPSVNISQDKSAAFQVRRYGYSAGLQISVLTNFQELAIYDCSTKPSLDDDPRNSRILHLTCDAYAQHFDQLWEWISRDAVYSGKFDSTFAKLKEQRGAVPFDNFFLEQVRKWRGLIAKDIVEGGATLSPKDLSHVVQRFLSKIIFLRICEDRNIEKYETLLKIGNHGGFGSLTNTLKQADSFYDSGLFDLTTETGLGIQLSDSVLTQVISDLYYPHSPYTFSVVEAEVLGEIYEQFLGEEIVIINGGVHIEQKQEVKEMGGVFPTPRNIVDAIVEETISPLIKGKRPSQLSGFTVMDPCCGSGIFLIATYERLLRHCADWYQTNLNDEESHGKLVESGNGQWRLTLKEKRRILLEHIRGVDVDKNAIEVAQLSLQLKLIEDLSSIDLKEFFETERKPVLPKLGAIIKCGNSLIRPAEWEKTTEEFTDLQFETINPFSWEDEFAAEMGRGGFDAIVANPPYVRIQALSASSKDEVLHYQHAKSPYLSAQHDNFDKYYLFIERIISLLHENGRSGIIVPHKFMIVQAGHGLRAVLADGKHVLKITHFGTNQVFQGATNYTCILQLAKKAATTDTTLEKVDTLDAWLLGTPGRVTSLQLASGGDAWKFADSTTEALINRIKSECPSTLEAVAEISVGMQTSADKVFIFKGGQSDEKYVYINNNGALLGIEREVLRPCIRKGKIPQYSCPKALHWIIFPYEIIGDEHGGKTAKLIQPNDFSSKYPGCWEYLNSKRAILEKRNFSGTPISEENWYQFGRSQSLTKFKGEKIIFPVLTKTAQYALDVNDSIVTGGGNGPYYTLRAKEPRKVSNKVLLGILHHPLSEAIIKQCTSVFRGGYYSHGKQFIEKLPIPHFSAEDKTYIESKVTKLISCIDADQGRTAHDTELQKRKIFMLKNEIESKISELFGISDEDMEIISATDTL